MRVVTTGVAALCLMLGMPALAAGAPTPDQQATMQRLGALLKDLRPISGDVTIAPAKAVLHLGKAYYFLDAAQAKRVLIEAWGNPPEGVSDVLGLVLPAGKTVLDDTWGAVVTYRDDGYVKDDDARTADYNALLEQVRGDETAINAERTKKGYPAQHLVGWAQTPAYDPQTHSMVWAQDIQFAGHTVDTLNYDVRLLGRSGVLSLNMISSMADLAGTRTAAAAFGRTAAFEPGARYADYKSGTDKTADYGLAGLVAAGVGAVAVKKLGLLAVILGFGKKFAVIIVALFAALRTRIQKLLGRGPAEEG